MKILTPKQKKFYDAIKMYIEKNGYSPTIRELNAMLGYSSPQTAWHYLNKLKKEGYIEMTPHKYRTIKLIEF
jgi:repressor LexA